MLDTEVYIKTDAGRDEIKSRAKGLPMSVRAILLMVDGQRPVSAMRSLIAGSKAPADVLDALVEQGLIEPRNGAAPALVAPAPVVAPVVPTAIEVAPPSAAPLQVVAPRPVAAPPVVDPPVVSYDGPLDLVLPTIYGPDPVDLSLAPAPEPAMQAPIVAAADPAPPDRYEHLYTMMNEIVRDFLAPHRRYFLQLKIERCTKPEELLELLYDLQTALAKTRGEAFASDVISRLRNAAA